MPLYQIILKNERLLGRICFAEIRKIHTKFRLYLTGLDTNTWSKCNTSEKVIKISIFFQQFILFYLSKLNSMHYVRWVRIVEKSKKLQ